MAFGRGFPIAIELDPMKEQDLVCAKEEVDEVFQQITASLASIKHSVFHCLGVQDPSFRGFVWAELTVFLNCKISDADLDAYFQGESERVTIFIRERFLEYQDALLCRSEDLKPTLYRQKMMEQLLRDKRITMKGMRQQLQVLFNPEYVYAHLSQPDVDNTVYLQVFDELRSQFGKPAE